MEELHKSHRYQLDNSIRENPSDVMYRVLSEKLGRKPQLEDIPKILMYMHEVHEILNDRSA